jgi:hypothetical protein
LGAEQIKVRNETDHRLEHICAIVYEVRYTDLSAVHGFLWPLTAKAYVAAVDTGALKEAMAIKPLHRPFLNSPSTFGNDPHLPAKPAHKRWNHIEHALVRGRVQCVIK